MLNEKIKGNQILQPQISPILNQETNAEQPEKEVGFTTPEIQPPSSSTPKPFPENEDIPTSSKKFI